MTKPQRYDPIGMPYDHTWVDSQGDQHYTLFKGLGNADGPSSWSHVHSVNPTCEHHLAFRCGHCMVCTECDGCYCREDLEHPF